MANGVHVVFGAGQIGPLVAAELRARGRAVRIVRKSPRAVDVPGAELMRGDAMDPAFCAEAARGAEVVYHCINAPYEARVWARMLPRIQDNLVAAAGRAGARLVVLDNLYSLGRPGGRPLSEDSPIAPVSRKGEIRARLAAALQAAERRGDVRAAVGRASDFYGPGGVVTYFGELFWRRVLAGKPGLALANPDTPHTYHFVRDVALGLVLLGEDREATGRTWMLPCAPAVTTRALVGKFAEALGRPIALGRVPRLVLSAAGLFVPILREVAEMTYQWDEPFVVDDRRFRERYGDRATPVDEGARQTVAWARQAFGAAAPRPAERLGPGAREAPNRTPPATPPSP
jgi:nucleoside-diphosphate-sugar epimerase